LAQRKSNGEEKNTLKKTLVLYTMNEIDGIKAIFDKIPIRLFDQFFVMDNHSDDGTVEFLEENNVKVIQQKKPGRTNALIEAAEYAVGDIIVNLSSDGNEKPEDIPKILEKFDEGYEMVTASRFLPDSKVDVGDDKLRIRVFGNKNVHNLLPKTRILNLSSPTSTFESGRNLLAVTISYPSSNFSKIFGISSGFSFPSLLRFTIISPTAYSAASMSAFVLPGFFC
jgi:glycosyltransferase involved in cell wall biosynthesis